MAGRWGGVWGEVDESRCLDAGDPLVVAGVMLRYLLAGTFMVGSPFGELGREDNEHPHKITLTCANVHPIQPRHTMTPLNLLDFLSARGWVRTSDFIRVRDALSR